MDTPHAPIWGDFDRHAHDCLRSSSVDLEPYPAPALARGLVLPAFSQRTGYALYRTADHAVVGVSLRWEYALNRERFAQSGAMDALDGLEEHVRSNCAGVDPREVDQLSNALLAARIPAVPGPGSIGLDGVSYELEFGEWFHRARFHWWLQPPRGWKPLDTFFQGMIQLIDTAIVQSRPVDRQHDDR